MGHSKSKSARAQNGYSAKSKTIRLDVRSANIEPIAEMKIDGDLLANWREWKQTFEVYVSLLGFEKNNDSACALFLHTIGQQGRDVFNTFQITKPYILQEFYNKFEHYYNSRTNLVLNRHDFFNTKQQKGQSFNEFLEILRQKSFNCQFEGLYDNFMLIQIVSGIVDNSLRNQLLKIPDLTVSEAVIRCNAAEQVQQLRSESKVELPDTKGKSDIGRPLSLQSNNRNPKIRNSSNVRSRHPQNREHLYKPKPVPINSNEHVQLNNFVSNFEKVKLSDFDSALRNTQKQNSHFTKTCNVDKQRTNKTTSYVTDTFKQKPEFRSQNENRKNYEEKCSPFKTVNDDALKLYVSSNQNLQNLAEKPNIAIYCATNVFTMDKSVDHLVQPGIPNMKNCFEGLNISPNCEFCGFSHKYGNCPAYGKRCYKCGLQNHFSRNCKN